jgi:hypothetical protein
MGSPIKILPGDKKAPPMRRLITNKAGKPEGWSNPHAVRGLLVPICVLAGALKVNEAPGGPFKATNYRAPIGFRRGLRIGTVPFWYWLPG